MDVFVGDFYHLVASCGYWRKLNIYQKRKKKKMMTWSKQERIGGDHSFKLLARSLCLLSYSQDMFEYPQKKPKAQKAKISYRFDLKKDLMIHNDYAHYPWFAGKWLAKLIYDIFGIEMKHLLVWSFIHLWEVFLYLIESSVSFDVL